MFGFETWKALEAAVDVAYDGADDPERLRMEDLARQALAYLKAAVEAPKAEGKRWRVLTGSHKAPSILMCAKGMMSVDPHGKIILMPEVDYDRLFVRIMALESLATKYESRQAEIDDLLAEADAEAKAQNAVYLPPKDDTQPEAPDGTTGQDVGGRPDEGPQDEVSTGRGGVSEAVPPDGGRTESGAEAPAGEGQAPR